MIWRPEVCFKLWCCGLTALRLVLDSMTLQLAQSQSASVSPGPFRAMQVVRSCFQELSGGRPTVPWGRHLEDVSNGTSAKFTWIPTCFRLEYHWRCYFQMRLFCEPEFHPKDSNSNEIIWQQLSGASPCGGPILRQDNAQGMKLLDLMCRMLGRGFSLVRLAKIP